MQFFQFSISAFWRCWFSVIFRFYHWSSSVAAKITIKMNVLFVGRDKISAKKNTPENIACSPIRYYFAEKKINLTAKVGKYICMSHSCAVFNEYFILFGVCSAQEPKNTCHNNTRSKKVLLKYFQVSLHGSRETIYVYLDVLRYYFSKRMSAENCSKIFWFFNSSLLLPVTL